MNDKERIKRLESIRGCMKMGQDSDEMGKYSYACSLALGFGLTVVWAFEDMWGYGGDNEVFARDNSDNIYDLPDGLWEFLTDGEGNAADLIGKPVGEKQKNPRYRTNQCNWSWKRSLTKELD